MNSEQKRVIKIAAIITFLLSGFVYVSNEDYAEEMRTETEFCGHSESIGASDTDLYMEECE